MLEFNSSSIKLEREFDVLSSIRKGDILEIYVNSVPIYVIYVLLDKTQWTIEFN